MNDVHNRMVEIGTMEKIMEELKAQASLRVLEKRTEKLEWQLKLAVYGWLLTVGVILVSAWSWQSKSETVDNLRARQITVLLQRLF